MSSAKMKEDQQAEKIALAIIATPFAIVVASVLIGLGTIVWGATLMVAWNWLMPALFGYPVLSLPAACAVRLIVSLVTPTGTPAKETKGLSYVMMNMAIAPPMVLLVAYVIKQFI